VLLELYEEQWWELSGEDGAWGEMRLLVVDLVAVLLPGGCGVAYIA
jgi:hypothetical protein